MGLGLGLGLMGEGHFCLSLRLFQQRKTSTLSCLTALGLSSENGSLFTATPALAMASKIPKPDLPFFKPDITPKTELYLLLLLLLCHCPAHLNPHWQMAIRSKEESGSPGRVCRHRLPRSVSTFTIVFGNVLI